MTAFNFVSFSNASPAVVSVSSNGAVTAMAPGSFALSATYAGMTGTLASAGTVSNFVTTAVEAIGVDVSDIYHSMSFHDYSGAPGVRTPYWNTLPAAGVNIDASLSSLMDSRGTLTNAGVHITGVGVLSVQYDATLPPTNEGALFGTYYATGAWGPSSTAQMNGYVSVTNIPYESYDVYCYVYNNTAIAGVNCAGHFIIDGVEKFRQNSTALAPAPNADGTGYVEAVQPATSPTSIRNVPAGHYVKFTGITDPNLTITYGGVAPDEISDSGNISYGTTNTSMYVAGFQIVKSVHNPITMLHRYSFRDAPGVRHHLGFSGGCQRHGLPAGGRKSAHRA